MTESDEALITLRREVYGALDGFFASHPEAKPLRHWRMSIGKRIIGALRARHVRFERPNADNITREDNKTAPSMQDNRRERRHKP